ncbi:MAG: hypothetical protein U0800_09650 [Isosphaeraceae bacterium]
MSPIAMTLLALFGATAQDPPTPFGHYRVVGNDIPGWLVITDEFDRSIGGTIYEHALKGRFDLATRQVTFQRLISYGGGDIRPVQEFQGVLRYEDAPAPRRVISGTFRSVAGPEWGADGVDYPWQATELSGTVQAEELKQMAGRWEVVDSQWPGGLTRLLPLTSPLARPGAILEIRNNQVLHEGEVIATLANDVRMPDTMPAMRPTRKPLVIVFPDGTAYLTAYNFRPQQVLEIVYPHTTGNVGRSHFLYWKRPAEAGAGGRIGNLPATPGR